MRALILGLDTSWKDSTLVIGSLADNLTRGVENVASTLASPFTDTTIRLGVTGLARAGKTVFITSLVANLMDRARMGQLMAEAEGTPREEAVLESGGARMRPILMTTVAMIAGMLPIALGVGAGAEIRQAMAIAVIGGLITSTFLTLLVVPVVHTYIDDLERFVMTYGLGWLKRHREDEETPQGPT